MAISDNELIYLCAPSYGYPPVGQYIIGQNNERYLVVETNYFGKQNYECGLDAIVIEKQPSGEKAMIFVGSKQMEDWYTDFQLTNPGEVPQQFTAALNYYQQVCNKYGIQMPVTGNSLGGGLANYVAVHNPGTISVTLNPAMLPKADEKFDEQNANNIRNYIDDGEILHKVQELAQGVIPGQIIPIQTSVDSPYRMGDLHTGRHESGINSASFIPKNLFTGSTLVTGENININAETLKCFGEEIKREFKLIDNNCYNLTTNNINLSNTVAEERVKREGTLSESTQDFMYNNFFSILESLDKKLGIDVAKIVAIPTMSGHIEIKNEIRVDLYEIFANKINIWGVTSKTLYDVLHTGGNKPLGKKLSSLNQLLTTFLSNIENIIDDMISDIVSDSSGYDVVPSQITQLSQYIQCETIILSQNLLRVGYVAMRIGENFKNSDDACDNFVAKTLEGDAWEKIEKCYEKSNMWTNPYGIEPLKDKSLNTLELNSSEVNAINALKTNLGNFDDDILGKKFDTAFDSCKRKMQGEFKKSLTAICRELISLPSAIQYDNGEPIISLWGPIEELAKEKLSSKGLRSEGGDINLDKLCQVYFNTSFSVLMNTITTAAHDIKDNLNNIDQLVESMKETIRNAIFYPESLENINNNNSISYNTLITIEKELSAACAMIDDNSSASLKQLKQVINDELLIKLRELKNSYEIITTN